MNLIIFDTPYTCHLPLIWQCQQTAVLAENNRYYRVNAIRLNEEALQRLPQDGNLTDMRSLQLGESSTYQCKPSEDLYGAHLSTSFVLYATQQRTEQETVQQSIQDL